MNIYKTFNEIIADWALDDNLTAAAILTLAHVLDGGEVAKLKTRNPNGRMIEDQLRYCEENSTTPATNHFIAGLRRHYLMKNDLTKGQLDSLQATYDALRFSAGEELPS